MKIKRCTFKEIFAVAYLDACVMEEQRIKRCKYAQVDPECNQVSSYEKLLKKVDILSEDLDKLYDSANDKCWHSTMVDVDMEKIILTEKETDDLLDMFYNAMEYQTNKLISKQQVLQMNLIHAYNRVYKLFGGETENQQTRVGSQTSRSKNFLNPIAKKDYYAIIKL